MLTFDIFKAFWQDVSPDLHFPGTIVGDDATYTEWKKGSYTYQGMRKAGGAKHGVIREVRSRLINSIYETTYFEDKKHGLSFGWYNDYDYAFVAQIFEHGKEKARIRWRDDWLMGRPKNKELILKNDGLSLFKP